MTYTGPYIQAAYTGALYRGYMQGAAGRGTQRARAREAREDHSERAKQAREARDKRAGRGSRRPPLMELSEKMLHNVTLSCDRMIESKKTNRGTAEARRGDPHQGTARADLFVCTRPEAARDETGRWLFPQ